MLVYVIQEHSLFGTWGVRLKCYALLLVCCGRDTSYLVSIHIQCQASIYTLSLCRGHTWRVRLVKQETLTPPGHLVSPLVCRDPWMSTVVLYCWCNSDSESVFFLYFTFYFISDTSCNWVGWPTLNQVQRNETSVGRFEGIAWLARFLTFQVLCMLYNRWYEKRIFQNIESSSHFNNILYVRSTYACRAHKKNDKDTELYRKTSVTYLDQ